MDEDFLVEVQVAERVGQPFAVGAPRDTAGRIPGILQDFFIAQTARRVYAGHDQRASAPDESYFFAVGGDDRAGLIAGGGAQAHGFALEGFEQVALFRVAGTRDIEVEIAVVAVGAEQQGRIVEPCRVHIAIGMAGDVDAAAFFFIGFFDKYFPAEGERQEFAVGGDGEFAATRAEGFGFGGIEALIGIDLDIDFLAIALACLHQVEVHIFFEDDSRTICGDTEVADSFVFEVAQLFGGSRFALAVYAHAVQVVGTLIGGEEVQGAVISPLREDIIRFKSGQ